MNVKRFRKAAALGLVLSLSPVAAAQEGVWQAVSTTQRLELVASSQAAEPAAILGRPIARASAEPDVVPQPIQQVSNRVIRGQYPDPVPPPPLPPAAPWGNEVVPVSSAPSAQTGGGPVAHSVSGPPESVPPPPAGPVNEPGYNSGVVIDRPLGNSFWDKCTGWLPHGDQGSCNNRCKFQSDHEFDCFISPVTNPFFFEDPRSLTEVRPIFIYQNIPSHNPVFSGGNAGFFGAQGRVAITDRFSIVLNELGWVYLNPNDTAVAGKDVGFAEVKVGPKYTFIRNPGSGTVLAGGLTFEIPTGDSKVFQNTGSLSLDPYVTIMQQIGRAPSGYGSFNLGGELGYSVSTDDKRTDFLHMSAHLDMNVANANKIYPLMELNWFHYTSGGKSTDLGIAGGDLINFGSHDVGVKDYVNMAFGARYKFCEAAQIGAAFSWPLSYSKTSIDDFRFTLDFIYRY
jgi:hypothetical protein